MLCGLCVASPIGLYRILIRDNNAMLTAIFHIRMFVNNLVLSLYALSLMRLEISISPFRFQSHDHKRVSTYALILILSLPMAEMAIRLVVQGYDCDCDTFVLVRGLYEGNELVPAFSTFTCSQVNGFPNV